MEQLKSVGIVAEYNPFHNGHLYHLKKSLEKTGAEVSVAVISGNLTQRGQFPIADKWTRAETAVRCGVDLVVEMPVIYSCNSAGYFAASGVEILENLGVDFISFGSEAGDIRNLKEQAAFLSEWQNEIEQAVKMAVKQGLTYPRARQEVLEKMGTDGAKAAAFLKDPNNILALEYLRHMKKAEGVTIKREGPGYNEEKALGTFAPASYIRNCIRQKEDIRSWVPAMTLKKLQNRAAVTEERFFQMILQKCFSSSAEELENLAAAGEGLGNKVKDSLRYCRSYEELVDELKSKRYTRSRICRLLGQALVGITADDMAFGKNYVRVLAFNEKGSGYLKKVKKQGLCNLPVITNINRELPRFPEIRTTIEKDILVSDLYNLAAGRDLYLHSDFVETVRICMR